MLTTLIFRHFWPPELLLPSGVFSSPRVCRATPLGIHLGHTYTNLCAKGHRYPIEIWSTRASKMAMPRICPGRVGSSLTQRWYVQLAVNRQPGYRQGNS